MWEHDLDDGLRILRLGVDTHLITSHCLLPLLIERPGGLLVEVTDGTGRVQREHYRLSVFYDLAKIVGRTGSPSATARTWRRSAAPRSP